MPLIVNASYTVRVQLDVNNAMAALPQDVCIHTSSKGRAPRTTGLGPRYKTGFGPRGEDSLTSPAKVHTAKPPREPHARRTRPVGSVGATTQRVDTASLTHSCLPLGTHPHVLGPSMTPLDPLPPLRCLEASV